MILNAGGKLDTVIGIKSVGQLISVIELDSMYVFECRLEFHQTKHEEFI